MSTKSASDESDSGVAGDYIITKYSLPKALAVKGPRFIATQSRALSQ